MVLLLTHAAVTWFLMGLIWIVQVVHYPLMAEVGAESYSAYQQGHMQRITWVVAPTMVLEALTALWIAVDPPMTTTVLSDKAMRQVVDITRTAEIAYCRARPDYYGYDCNYAPADPRKDRALDFELKYLKNGRFICKQMREFSGK